MLGHPFKDDFPQPERREAAQTLWKYHLGLWRGPLPASDAAPDGPHHAEQVCAAYDLPAELLAVQAGAARRLELPVRFTTGSELKPWIRAWAGAHARLLAHLGGVAHRWNHHQIEELAIGHFLTARLVALPDDLEQDRLFIPTDELDHFGVPLEALRRGDVEERARRLLWKQAIRARDALGQGRPFMQDLEGSTLRGVRRWWNETLEVLDEVERRGFDVWSGTLALPWWRRAHLSYQTWLGKAALRRR